MDLVSKRFGLVVVGLAVSLMACAAPAIPSDQTDEPEQNEEEEETPKKNTLPPSTNTDAPPEGETTPTSTPKDCSGEATADACGACCDPGNAIEPAMNVFGNCVCGTPGTCAAECGASFCNGLAPDAACKTCLDAATQCNADADKACGADCKAALTCSETSKCTSK